MNDLFNGVISLQKNSFIDFPGRASALLFYGGCNLRCPFCHNATLACGNAESRIDHDEVTTFLKKRRKFLEGVVITGGEPTLYKTMPDLVKWLKDDLGYEVKLDSNGLNPEMLKKTNYDYLAMDLKSSFVNYREQLAAPADAEEKIRRSLDILKSHGENAEVRITCAPGIVNDAVIEEMLPLLEGVHNVFLQPFKYSDDLINPKFFIGQPHISDDDLERFREKIGTVVQRCEVRGR